MDETDNGMDVADRDDVNAERRRQSRRKGDAIGAHGPQGDAHPPASGTCPVCLSEQIDVFMQVERKCYWRCRRCAATYLERSQLPSAREELQRYQQHRNDVHDPRYRAFLSRLAMPLLRVLPPKSRGLDYGCGPGPALAHMLREAGHSVRLYDPFFEPDAAALAQTYDFITCTEVVEHFHDPAREFARLYALLENGGTLAIMTCFQTDDAGFANWRYRRDPTHVVMYREQTFRYLATHYGLSCEIPGKDIVLLTK